MSITKEQYEARIKWAKALESGEYIQTDSALRKEAVVDGELCSCFCCLGVACDLFHQDTAKGEWLTGRAFAIEGEPSYDYLPLPVMKWLGFSENDPCLPAESGYISATTLNDTAGWDFKDIAKAVRESAERDYKPEDAA